MQPPRVDVAIAAAFVLLAWLEVAVNDTVESAPLHVVVGGLAMASLAWRRRFPIAVAVVVVAANLVINPEGEYTPVLSLVLTSFTVGAELDAPRSAVGLAAVAVPFVAGLATAGFLPSDVAAALVFVLGPWAVGTLARRRTAAAAAAVARADRLELEQELRADLAAAAERTRIARELHDVVSHSISVISIQTQAVRRRLGPEHAAEAADLAAVEATARGALAEMRRLFGVLRADGEAASLAPQPGLDQLGRLVETAGGGDVEVRLEVRGEPYPLPPGVDLAAYRIAQEGLTNALRHAGGTTATVALTYERHHLRVEVEDDGGGLPADGSGGLGLRGVRERAAMYGGSAEVCARPGGGVRLVATLPVRDVT